MRRRAPSSGEEPSPRHRAGARRWRAEDDASPRTQVIVDKGSICGWARRNRRNPREKALSKRIAEKGGRTASRRGEEAEGEEEAVSFPRVVRRNRTDYAGSPQPQTRGTDEPVLCSKFGVGSLFLAPTGTIDVIAG